MTSDDDAPPGDSGDDLRPAVGHTAHAEVEVPASPEQVWEAIATRHGTGAWMFTTDIEAREGGVATIHRQPFGPDAAAMVTAWEPPYRLAYEESVEGPGGSYLPPLATEYLVETRRGGTCIVRVITGMHQGGAEWEDLIEGAAEGWRMALVVLHGYLAHFAGQAGVHLDVISPVGRPLDDGAGVFASLNDQLGLAGLAAGDPFRAPDGAPPVAGTLDHVAGSFALLRTSEPCSGLLALSTFSMDGAALTVNLAGRLYGPDAHAVAGRERPRWEAWLAERFPA